MGRRNTPMKVTKIMEIMTLIIIIMINSNRTIIGIEKNSITPITIQTITHIIKTLIISNMMMELVRVRDLVSKIKTTTILNNNNN
jgi:hypothetical protein